ncbi:basic proline-rich protein-like [Vulpes lagopus]|uniref:basic proline-rich protein-like n=1 Tax=Vulpes lagopus TaxID=494514 RepID=UPI001BC9CAA8|nr:basic proline-rich protein-like [Vulpes lagopus]
MTLGKGAKEAKAVGSYQGVRPPRSPTGRGAPTVGLGGATAARSARRPTKRSRALVLHGPAPTPPRSRGSSRSRSGRRRTEPLARVRGRRTTGTTARAPSSRETPGDTPPRGRPPARRAPDRRPGPGPGAAGAPPPPPPRRLPPRPPPPGPGARVLTLSLPKTQSRGRPCGNPSLRRGRRPKPAPRGSTPLQGKAGESVEGSSVWLRETLDSSRNPNTEGCRHCRRPSRMNVAPLQWNTQPSASCCDIQI